MNLPSLVSVENKNKLSAVFVTGVSYGWLFEAFGLLFAV